MEKEVQSAMAAIEVKNVHKAFGSVKAIDGLDLSIDEGQVCADYTAALRAVAVKDEPHPAQCKWHC
ncbi:MAG: hypothetical protein LBC35_06560 [Coriobacteriales bacterium]|nr:hypothetical protein [Coriobacteriales bacterium]